MSSINDLFDRVQSLEEAKVSPVGKQAPVFKNVPKQMRAAGLPASSRDAMKFITQVLSRLDIISPDVYEMTIKGQHRERMEKLMTILRAKEDEINAKTDEIVEYINQNLDNYTAAAGTDRKRSEKYKDTAKDMSQEVQNMKAGKEADDALRDVVVKLAKGLDDEVTDADIDALDFDEADIHINIADQDLKREVANKLVSQLNANGYTADVSGVGVNIEAPIGTFGSSADRDKMETVQDQLKGLVMSVEPKIGENEIDVKITTQEGTVSHEDGEGKYDDGDGKEERCDYVPCEDEEKKTKKKGKHDDGDDKDEKCDYVPCEDEEVVAESRYTTADYLDSAYANVKPIIESTVNENGQTTPTQKYLAEKAEEAIEEVYTNQYLTEQKASDSLLVPKEEKRESFKERYQPKTSYQLEELRRYGL